MHVYVFRVRKVRREPKDIQDVMGTEVEGSVTTSPVFLVFVDNCVFASSLLFFFWSDTSRGTQAGRENQAGPESQDIQDTM